jgi:hypothetical protein
MGILNNDTQTVDAILTKVGKRKMAEGAGLNISSFALGDDYVSYFLYNADHVSGSAQYGEAIEGLPLPEAVPSAANAIRSHLTTRDRNILYNPIIRLSGQDPANNIIRIEDQGTEGEITLSPKLLNAQGNDFVFKVFDETGLTFSGAQAVKLSPSVINYPRKQGYQVPAEFHGQHLKIQALATTESFRTLVSITSKTAGATVLDVEIVVDRNVYEKQSRDIKS